MQCEVRWETAETCGGGRWTRTALALSTMQPHQQPSNLFVLEYLISVSVIASFSFIAFKSSRSPKDLLKACGVSMRKVASAAREIERKTFHIAGLLVPLIHQILLSHKVSNRFCVQIVVTIAAVGGACDFARLHVPFVAANWPLAHILRDDEKKQLTGGTWYAWGCTLTMGAPPPARWRTTETNQPSHCQATTEPSHDQATTKPLPNQATAKPTNPAARAAISPPSIAITSILFLVLGDMSAAIIGVSFGREVSTVRIGRGGRKSMEGAVAMFAVCFVIGSTMFASVNLREYPVFFGALAATLTEVYEPLGLNDNLTIPFFASLAMQWGFARIQSCASEPPLHWILNGDMWTQLQRLPLA